MFQWLRSLWRRKPKTPKATVSFDERLVTCRRPNGVTEELTWDELVLVEIVTTDEGPFVDDIFYCLYGEQRGCVVPSEAEGCSELVERLTKLPGFNHQAVIDAMCCASNARFPAWQRDPASASSSG
jgi:hypothetical protein